MRRLDATAPAGEEEDEHLTSSLPPEERNPMEERGESSWAAVDLEPYLMGQVVMPEPSVLIRTDGKGLMYPGRVNVLFGASESAKSWIALFVCQQEMDAGERALYLDFEDMPEGTVARQLALGAAPDDIAQQFRYVHPEGPIADLQRYRFGAQPTPDGEASARVFWALVESFDPTIAVVDGMTVLYGLHGHDTNDAGNTDVITGWLKQLTRAGRTTVLVIDHTGKGAGPGASPIGAHHKTAMVQGTSLRVDVISRPMRGAVGTMRLIVFKDRPGAVREISTKATEQVAGLVTLDSTEPGITRMKVEPVDENDVVIAGSDRMEAKLSTLARLDDHREDVLKLFGGDMDVRLTTAMVVDAIGCTAVEAREVWELLISTKIVKSYGAGRGRYYLLRG
jgi:hypothetical protein